MTNYRRGVITVPGSLPSMNEIIAASKKHWAQYSNMKKENTEAVAWVAKGQELHRRVIVECTWYCGNKRKDPDNVQAGVKFVLDGLVEAGVLENDGWQQVAGIVHRFEIDRDNPRVEIHLREVV